MKFLEKIWSSFRLKSFSAHLTPKTIIFKDTSWELKQLIALCEYHHYHLRKGEFITLVSLGAILGQRGLTLGQLQDITAQYEWDKT